MIGGSSSACAASARVPAITANKGIERLRLEACASGTGREWPMKEAGCHFRKPPPYAAPEVGGRRCRQPGQVRKEAATTISCRVVGFHLPKFRAQRSDCGAIVSSA